MTRKVIAEPTGELCSENPCKCKCWCKAEWHIRYEEGGEFDYKGCAGMAPCIAESLQLFRCLEKQQPRRWSFLHGQKLVPLPEYWRDGEGKAQLPAAAFPLES